MDARRLLRESTVRVSEVGYAVLRCASAPREAFAIVDDGREITAIVEEGRAATIDAIESEAGWRVLTFEVVLPFGLVGFLARVADALARVGVGIFVVSAYSTDHILVKHADLDRACSALGELGCAVRR